MPTYFDPNRPTYGFNREITKVVNNLSASIFSASSDIGKFETAVNLLENDAVFISEDSRIYKTDITSPSSSLVIGFSNSNFLSGSIALIKQGRTLDGFVNLSIGKKYYLSESIGKISQEPPQFKNATISEVGIAKSSGELFFEPRVLIIL